MRLNWLLELMVVLPVVFRGLCYPDTRDRPRQSVSIKFQVPIVGTAVGSGT